MKSKLLYLVILVAGLMLIDFSVNQVNGQTPPAKQVKQQTVKYTCPMHPEVVMDKPGKCPKCGMTLVKKTDLKEGEMHHKQDSSVMKHNHMKMKDSMPMKKGMMQDTTKVMHGMKM
jgi:hypothetical protein